MEEKFYYIYILTNSSEAVLYVGVTNNLIRRMHEHQNKLIEGFTKKYNCTKLIYYEVTNDVYAALEREKQIKKWNRKKKEHLVNLDNPEWKDLSVDF